MSKIWFDSFGEFVELADDELEQLTPEELDEYMCELGKLEFREDFFEYAAYWDDDSNARYATAECRYDIKRDGCHF